MKIVTFNMRFAYNTDGIQSFIHRAGLILDAIAERKPDIICFQEANDQNIGFLRKYLAPDYAILLNRRGEGLTGEGLAVAYRPDQCSLHGLEAFWLSPTPQIIASKFPGQSMHPRICQRLWFKNEETGNTLRIYNLHLEELTEDIRLQQMEMVLRRSAEESEPTFLLGDLNTLPDGKVYAFCKEHGLVDLTGHISGSFHNFGKEEPIKIDYIFTDPVTAQRVRRVMVWDDCANGIYLSDHYPIEMDCDL